MLLNVVLKASRLSKVEIRSQAGLSLVEVLVGTVILAGLGVSVLYTTSVTSINRSQATNRFRCEANSASAISYLESQGLVSQIANWVSTDASGRALPAGLQFTGSYVDAADLWASNPAITDLSTPPILQNANLIGGSIRNLSAIYNKSPASFCSSAAGGTYAPLSSYLNSLNTGLPGGTTTTIQIQPYLLTTGVTDCTLPTPLLIYPKAKIEAQDIYNAKDGLNNYASRTTVGKYTSDYGLVVTVRTSFTENGQNFTCAAQHKFQYQQDSTPPGTMDMVVVTNNASLPIGNPSLPQLDCTPADSIALYTTVGYIAPTVPMESGASLLCADKSTKLTPTILTACHPGGANPGAQHSHSYAYTETSSPLGSSKWQACDKVTLCGVGPDSTTLIRTGNNFAIRNHYSGLPSDCVVTLQAAGVDTAGNLSPIGSLGTLGDPSPPRLYRPTCGYFCPWNVTWGPQDPSSPDGYYTCLGPAGCP